MKHRMLTGVAVAAVVAMSAAPAAFADQTRTLPAGATLYAMTCDAADGQLGTVNTATAAVTMIGSGSIDPHVACAEELVWNPVTQTAYWLTSVGGDHDDAVLELFTIDLTTGDSSYVGTIEPSGTDYIRDFQTAMVGADGQMYLIGSTRVDENADWAETVFTVDIDAMTFSAVADITVDGDPFPTTLYAGGFNPSDGTFYFVSVYDYDPDDNYISHLYSLDVSTGASVLLNERTDNFSWYNLAIDGDGTIWGGALYELASSTVAGWDDTATIQTTAPDVFRNAETDAEWDASALMVTFEGGPAPAPTPTANTAALAATGVAMTGAAGSVIALLVVGGALIATRKRTA